MPRRRFVRCVIQRVGSPYKYAGFWSIMQFQPSILRNEPVRKSKTEEIQIKWVLKWRQYRSNPLNRSLLLRLSTDMLCSLLFWLPPTPFYWVMVSLLPCFSQLFGCFLQCSNSATKGNKSEAKTYEIFKLLHFYGIEGKLRGKPEAELKKLVA